MERCSIVLAALALVGAVVCASLPAAHAAASGTVLDRKTRATGIGEYLKPDVIDADVRREMRRGLKTNKKDKDKKDDDDDKDKFDDDDDKDKFDDDDDKDKFDDDDDKDKFDDDDDKDKFDDDDDKNGFDDDDDKDGFDDDDDKYGFDDDDDGTTLSSPSPPNYP